jgi:hypothetical protein
MTLRALGHRSRHAHVHPKPSVSQSEILVADVLYGLLLAAVLVTVLRAARRVSRRGSRVLLKAADVRGFGWTRKLRRRFVVALRMRKNFLRTRALLRELPALGACLARGSAAPVGQRLVAWLTLRVCCEGQLWRTIETRLYSVVPWPKCHFAAKYPRQFEISLDCRKGSLTLRGHFLHRLSNVRVVAVVASRCLRCAFVHRSRRGTRARRGRLHRASPQFSQRNRHG